MRSHLHQYGARSCLHSRRLRRSSRSGGMWRGRWSDHSPYRSRWARVHLMGPALLGDTQSLCAQARTGSTPFAPGCRRLGPGADLACRTARTHSPRPPEQPVNTPSFAARSPYPRQFRAGDSRWRWASRGQESSTCPSFRLRARLPTPSIRIIHIGGTTIVQSGSCTMAGPSTSEASCCRE